MNIKECVDFINFWIRKDRGAFLTIEESVAAIDSGQLAYYSDIKPKYATSQLIKDTLAPFKKQYNFTPANTISGYIVIPSNVDYLDLLDVEIQFNISNRTVYAPVEMTNEDERSNKLNSQIDPPTVTSPVGEMQIPRYIKLYPQTGYTGTVTFFSRPKKPVYAYNVISGRVIQYDAANSVQLEWRDTEHIPILLKALVSVGINLSDAEVSQFAQLKTQENYQGVNHL
jgi:hypothetical protein